MASTAKKYVSVDEQIVVQNEMKFPAEKLLVNTGGNEYKDINQIFLKGVKIDGETTPLTPENGIVTITIPDPPDPPEPIQTQFATYSEMTAYIGTKGEDAAGLLVGVYNDNDNDKNGAYAILKQGSDLIPVKLGSGSVKSVVLRSGTPEGEETPREIPSEMEGDGTAVLDVSEMEFGDLEVDTLSIGGKDISQLIPNMQGLNGIEKLGATNTHDDVVDKLNDLIDILKEIATAQELPSSGTGN